MRIHNGFASRMLCVQVNCLTWTRSVPPRGSEWVRSFHGPWFGLKIRRRRSLVSAQGSKRSENLGGTIYTSYGTRKGFANGGPCSGFCHFYVRVPRLSLTLQPWAESSETPSALFKLNRQCHCAAGPIAASRSDQRSSGVLDADAESEEPGGRCS